MGTEPKLRMLMTETLLFNLRLFGGGRKAFGSHSVLLVYTELHKVESLPLSSPNCIHLIFLNQSALVP